MKLDENLPDTVLQDEDNQNGQNLLGSQIVHNMFTLDMTQPLVTWTVSETIIICSYAYILVSQCIQMLPINSQIYATSVTFMCIQL